MHFPWLTPVKQFQYIILLRKKNIILLCFVRYIKYNYSYNFAQIENKAGTRQASTGRQEHFADRWVSESLSRPKLDL